MPEKQTPSPLSPLASAGISMLGNTVGNFIQQGMSKSAQNQAYDLSMKQYERQRSDALADRQFENEYNSPAAQMARLKAAGLNPNLVYGEGVQAAGQSSSARSSQVGHVQPIPTPSNPLSDGINTYLRAKLQDAQIDKIIQDTKTSSAQEYFIKAKEGTEAWKYETEQQRYNSMRLDNYLKEQTQGTNIEIRKQQLDKLIADTKFTLNQDERNAASNSMSLQEAMERILVMRQQRAKSQEEMKQIGQQIDNLKQDYRIKMLDEEMSKMGIDKSSPSWLKSLNYFANGIYSTASGKPLVGKFAQ